MMRSMVRDEGGAAIGHASIAEQLRWCARAGVRRAVFTHCGSGIDRADPRRARARDRALGAALGIDASIAGDGEELDVRGLAIRRARR
jgi:hypothetical protein